MDVSHQLRGGESPKVSFSHYQDLPDHGGRSVYSLVTFDRIGSQPQSSEGRLVDICGPEMMSVFFGKLVIIPHGALHNLPFHAFHDGEDILIDRHEISFASSASVLRY